MKSLSRLLAYGVLWQTILTASAQVTNVSELVSFDTYASPTDNDYTRNLVTAWTPNPFSQVTAGGISGGALEPKTYGSFSGALLSASIDFRF